MNAFVKLFCGGMLLMSVSCTYVGSEKPLFTWENTDAASTQPFLYPAWRGEKVNAQAVISSEIPLEDAALEVHPLRTGFRTIPADAVEASFVGYVKGDELVGGLNQCGARDTINFKMVEVADHIGFADRVNIKEGTLQPVWVSVKVPADAASGLYKGKVTLRYKGGCAELEYKLEVVSQQLPPPSQWSFHLDLWQNPYAVARYHGVELWSDAHFEAMRPVMKLLSDAGQKVVTTTIMDKPWHGQTYDPFESMVSKTLFKDGRWKYDYTVFDKWVEFMEEVGISKQINCYTLIPWDLTFDYIDGETLEVKYMRAEPGSADYAFYWNSFITDFAGHLREKGWFDKTYIAMDERPADAMRAALDLVHSSEPEFKIALAGYYHDTIADEVDDLCVTFYHSYPEGSIERRRSAGQISTCYTCCAERMPNTFMSSPREEAAWIPWAVLCRGLDGYLRWAYNSWTESPTEDSRFRTWAAGDCYMVYPNGESSTRFEKLREGIQDYEKARILLDRWEDGSPEKEALKEAIRSFTFEDLAANGPVPALQRARSALAGK